jgi:hypothetical protein
MRTYYSSRGPFKEGLFLEDHEINNICEDELRTANLLPSTPSPIRIDRFIEKRFMIAPGYVDLPPGVLGATVFGAKGVQGILVARSLDNEGTQVAERRLRTTLAHEAGHGLLHAHLFLDLERNRQLFGDYSDPDAPRILCREISGSTETATNRYKGEWWEYQANRAIGGLLLPRNLVLLALELLLENNGNLGGKSLPADRRENASRLLAETFEVNPVVARIRVDQLFAAEGDGQLSL